jgi:RNA polymerase sigma factor (TIGR02999 family)
MPRPRPIAVDWICSALEVNCLGDSTQFMLLFPGHREPTFLTKPCGSSDRVYFGFRENTVRVTDGSEAAAFPGLCGLLLKHSFDMSLVTMISRSFADLDELVLRCTDKKAPPHGCDGYTFFMEELRNTEPKSVMSRHVAQANGTDPGQSTGSEQERKALDLVFSLVYEELRSLASPKRRREFDITVNSTALVHEAWMKLKDSPYLAATSLPHFKALAARAVRQVLVDEARRRRTEKRGNEFVLVPMEELDTTKLTMIFDSELLAPEADIQDLSARNARQARVVKCRFFGGVNVSETAEILGVSESVIERDWRNVKAWLAITIPPRPGL